MQKLSLFIVLLLIPQLARVCYTCKKQAEREKVKYNKSCDITR